MGGVNERGVKEMLTVVEISLLIILSILNILSVMKKKSVTFSWIFPLSYAAGLSVVSLGVYCKLLHHAYQEVFPLSMTNFFLGGFPMPH